MPGVADVRVIGAEDPRRGEQIVACIVAERAGTIQALAVRRYCAARLAPHKIPRAIVFVDTIPTTARGKVDRAAMAEIVRATTQRIMPPMKSPSRASAWKPLEIALTGEPGSLARLPVHQPARPAKSFQPKWADAPLLKSHERTSPQLGWPRTTDSLCPTCVRETREAILSGRRSGGSRSSTNTSAKSKRTSSSVTAKC